MWRQFHDALLLYISCSKCPPPVDKQFSARFNSVWMAEAMLSGWFRTCIRVKTREIYSSFGKTPSVLFNSNSCTTIAKSIHEMHVTIFHVGKHKRHFSNSVQLPYEPLTTHPQRVLRYQAEGKSYAVQGSRERNFRKDGASIRLVQWQVQFVDPPEDHTFLWPLSP